MPAFSKYALVLLFVAHSSLAAVSVDDYGNTSSYRPRSGLEMRTTRRVGIGLTGGGAAGTIGTNLELNFSDESGIVLGFGGGSPSFQSFWVQYKGVLTGDWLLPYYTLGYTHWENYGKQYPVSETTPGFLAEKFMSEKEKREGRINENLLLPGFGLQYVKLGGSFAGSSLYLEVQVLIDIADFIAAPTASFGYLYYF